MTTYTGPTYPRFLIHGQKVIRVPRGVMYDPADPRHNDCTHSVLTTITGVPESDLQDEQWTADEANERAWKR